jgi:hypothetical protein
MADVNFEEVLKVVRSLAPEERVRLRKWLAENEQNRRSQGEPGAAQSAPRRAREMRWLSQHEARYAGQWIALDGDRLLSHGPDARKVYAEAHAAGVKAPFVAYAEDPNDFQWGGWL